MKKAENFPWETKNYDLEREHPDYELSRPYFFWIEYLRICPSIHLVHKYLHGTDELNEEDKKLCPQDLENVRQTYINFKLGALIYKKMSFAKWWDRHGRDLFLMPVNKSMVQHIATYPPQMSYGKISLGDIDEKLQKTLKGERYSFHTILSIPLSGDRKNILKQIDKLLSKEVFESYFMPRMSGYTFHRLSGERTHVEPLEIGLKMLYLKANNPDLANWRLGVKAGLSKKYNYLDPDAKTLSSKDEDARINMGNMAGRHLRKTIHIMENAALGQFPLEDATHLTKINFEVTLDAIRKRIEEINNENRKYIKYRPY
jgi:hypothetical protein